jgi:hypothetical protein
MLGLSIGKTPSYPRILSERWRLSKKIFMRNPGEAGGTRGRRLVLVFRLGNMYIFAYSG